MLFFLAYSALQAGCNMFKYVNDYILIRINNSDAYNHLPSSQPDDVPAIFCLGSVVCDPGFLPGENWIQWNRNRNDLPDQ